MSLTLDLSNHDWPLWPDPTDPRWQPAAMKAAGVAEVILGAQIVAVALDQAHDLARYDIPVRMTYAYLWDVESPAVRTQKAINVAKQTGAPRVALDMEKPEGGGTFPATLQQRIDQALLCRRMVEDNGLRPWVYTGRYFWHEQMGNTTLFSDLPLWLSDYGADDGQLRSPITTVDFGGWTKVAVHQATSTLWVAGRRRDANHVIIPWEDDDMTTEEAEALRKRVTELEYLLTGSAGYTQAVADASNVVEGDPSKAVLARLAALEGARANVEAAQAGAVPDHVHTPGGVARAD